MSPDNEDVLERLRRDQGVGACLSGDARWVQKLNKDAADAIEIRDRQIIDLLELYDREDKKAADEITRLRVSLKSVTESRDAATSIITRLRVEREKIAEALVPLLSLANAKGATKSSDELATVVRKILDEAPYPDSMRAVQQFCETLIRLRTLLSQVSP